MWLLEISIGLMVGVNCAGFLVPLVGYVLEGVSSVNAMSQTIDSDTQEAGTNVPCESKIPTTHDVKE